MHEIRFVCAFVGAVFFACSSPETPEENLDLGTEMGSLADGGLSDGDVGAQDAALDDMFVADEAVADEAVGDTAVDRGVVAPGEPMWIGVGNWGYRASTRDGATFTVVQGPEQANDHTPDLLRGVGFGDGAFIAVGGDRNSMVMRTRDGVSWEEDLYPDGRDWMGDVAYGNGRWVAVGGNGRVIVSEDGGDTWREGARLGGPGRSIGFDGSNFIAVGDGARIAVSPDGDSWEEHVQGGSAGLGSLATFEGLTVVGGRRWNGSGFDVACFTSADRRTWEPCPFVMQIDNLAGVSLVDGAIVVDTSRGHERWDGMDWHLDSLDLPDRVLGSAESGYLGVQGARRFFGDDWRELERVEDGERGFRDVAFGRL